MGQAFVLFAVIWGECFQLAVRNIYFSCFGGHPEWGRYGINSFWQPYPGRKARARMISQIERNGKFYTHWL